MTWRLGIPDQAIGIVLGGIMQQLIPLGFCIRPILVTKSDDIGIYALQAYPVQEKPGSQEGQRTLLGAQLAEDKLDDLLRAIIDAPVSSMHPYQQDMRKTFLDHRISIMRDGTVCPIALPLSTDPPKPPRKPKPKIYQTPISGCILQNPRIAVGYAELRGTLHTPFGEIDATVSLNSEIVMNQINAALAGYCLPEATVLETVRGRRKTYSLTDPSTREFATVLTKLTS